MNCTIIFQTRALFGFQNVCNNTHYGTIIKGQGQKFAKHKMPVIYFSLTLLITLLGIDKYYIWIAM